MNQYFVHARILGRQETTTTHFRVHAPDYDTAWQEAEDRLNRRDVEYSIEAIELVKFV